MTKWTTLFAVAFGIFCASSIPALSWNVLLDSCYSNGAFGQVVVTSGQPKANCQFVYTDVAGGFQLNGNMSVNGTKGTLSTSMDGGSIGLAGKTQLIDNLFIAGPWIGTNPISVTLSMTFDVSVLGDLANVSSGQIFMAMVANNQPASPSYTRVDGNISGGTLQFLPTGAGSSRVVFPYRPSNPETITLETTTTVDSVHPNLPIQFELTAWGPVSTTFDLRALRTSTASAKVSITLPRGFKYKSDSGRFLNH